MQHADTTFTQALGALRKSTMAAVIPAAGLLVVNLVLLFAPGIAFGMPVVLIEVLMSAALLGALSLGHKWTGRRMVAYERGHTETVANAHRDALTGAFTRSYFLGCMKRCLQGEEPRLGYLQIDMDNLKQLNDGYGHAAGDAALKHMIASVARHVPNGILGRLGGDEFGILVVDEGEIGALRALGERILAGLCVPTAISGRTMRVSATIGVAAAPRDGTDPVDLTSKADLALYEGKRAGRSRVVTFDDEMLVDARHKRFIERELRAAILLNELELHYQPVFAADTKTLKGYEALVRWRHPVRSLIPPSQFIPIAEQSTLIDNLGDWVLKRACRDIEALGHARVSVNVSAAQLHKPDFALRFIAILRDHAVDASQIIVEVTETVPLSSGAVEMANLRALRDHGVKVAIDDFGAGYANLQYLRNFAFDIIKIDRTYIANLETSRVDAMIVSAICRIARMLKVEVIAEGVETPAQCRMLEAAGCTAMQGFLLGRPAALGHLTAAPAVASVA